MNNEPGKYIYCIYYSTGGYEGHYHCKKCAHESSKVIWQHTYVKRERVSKEWYQQIKNKNNYCNH